MQSLSLSLRVLKTDPAIIDIVLSKYADMSGDVYSLAQGVAYWDPPAEAMQAAFGKDLEVVGAEGEGEGKGEASCQPSLLAAEALTSIEAKSTIRRSIVTEKSTHRYGAVSGLTELRTAIADLLQRERGLDMSNQDVIITAGANQGFANIVLALLDPGDVVVFPRPYYFSHLCSCQLAGAEPMFCEVDKDTFLPNMDHLRSLLQQGHGEGEGKEERGEERGGGDGDIPSSKVKRVKLLVITTPGNPSGAVVPQQMMEEIVALCKKYSIWLVVDEAYEHFIFNDNDDDDVVVDDHVAEGGRGGGKTSGENEAVQHYSPCAGALNFEGIIHLYTLSKTFGMAGWRIGYVVYPKAITEHMRKCQDTIPTHASIASQKLAYACITMPQSTAWVQARVTSLKICRKVMWNVIRDLKGTVQCSGAFYYLVPVPSGLSELEAVDILATGVGVLLTPGSAFGMAGYLRLSYGSLPEEKCLKAAGKLKEGLALLAEKAAEKNKLSEGT